MTNFTIYILHLIFLKGHGSIVGIENGYGLDDQKARV
jgi:hypothetical protein